MKRNLPFRLLVSLLLCGFAPSGFAQLTFTDNFERAELGADWSATGGDWTIDQDNRLRSADGNTSNHLIYFNGFELTDTWSMVAHVEFLVFDQHWQGFGMNVQEVEGTYRSYIDRFRTQEAFGAPATAGHQFLEGEGAGGDLSFPNTATGQPSTELDINTIYRFELAWDAEVPDTITLEIRDNGTTVLDQGFGFADWNDWTGAGFAGFYDMRSMAVHDVELTVVPEPQTTGAVVAGVALLLTLWARRRLGRR